MYAQMYRKESLIPLTERKKKNQTQTERNKKMKREMYEQMHQRRISDTTNWEKKGEPNTDRVRHIHTHT